MIIYDRGLIVSVHISLIYEHLFTNISSVDIDEIRQRKYQTQHQKKLALKNILSCGGVYCE